MFLAATLSALGFQPVPYLFDGLGAKQEHTVSERIHATSEVYTPNGFLTTNYVIEVERPNRWKLTIKPNKVVVHEEVYYYDLGQKSGVCVIYRPKSGQYVQSTAEASNLTEFIGKVTPNIDEFLIALATQHGFDILREKLDISNSKWSFSNKGDKTTLKYKQDDGTTEVTFPAKSQRPSNFTFVNMTGVIKWNLKYEAGSKFINPAAAKGSYEVVQFDEMLGKAKATSSAAEQTLNLLLGHYDAPKSLGYTVTSATEKFTVQFTPKMAYQSDDKAAWTYDGRELKLYNKRLKTLFVGAATSAELLDYVAQTGSRVEHNLRSLLIGRNPYRIMLNDYTTVSQSKGSSLPESAQWISAKTSMFSVNMAVAKDGFVLKLESEPITIHGEKLPKTVTTFVRKTGAIPNSIAPAGTRSKSLSEMP